MYELPGAPGLEEALGAWDPGLNGPFLSLQQAHPLFVGLFVCSLPQAVSVLLFLPQGSAWGRRLQERWASSIPRALLISPQAGGPMGVQREGWSSPFAIDLGRRNLFTCGGLSFRTGFPGLGRHAGGWHEFSYQLHGRTQ